jgi:hypothetical protein
MSTALFPVPGVTSPLQTLWRWLVPVKKQDQPSSPGMGRRANDIAASAPATHVHRARGELKLSHRKPIHRPLRIVRILEAGQAPANVGRMMISGRMADVCAELDRLAALH